MKENMKNRIQKLFTLIVLIIPITSTAKAEENELFINNSSETIYIYSDPTVSDNPIAEIEPLGSGYIEKNSDTLKIISGNYHGYIKNENLLIGAAAWTKAEKDFEKQAIIKSDTQFVYENRELDGRVVDLLCQDDIVSVQNQEKDTLEVITENNIDGYITSANAEVTPVFKYATKVCFEDFYDDPEMDGLGSYQNDTEYDAIQGIDKNVIGEMIVEYACSCVGNPYVWGGTSLTEGADCSGFVQSVYANYDIYLPRTSEEQRESGIKICVGWNEEKAQPGDIVCYEGHVAIYIGNGQIVHAANKKDGIKITNADYREVLCVRRIIGSRKAMYLNDQEEEVLCKIVEAEAGNQDFKGKLLVANVILNRVVAEEFPSTVQDVVFQKSGAKYQFSPISDGRYYQVKISRDTREAVKKAIKGIDPSNAALYFMNSNLSDPDNVIWFQSKLTCLFTYGNHTFYK